MVENEIETVMYHWLKCEIYGNQLKVTPVLCASGYIQCLGWIAFFIPAFLTLINKAQGTSCFLLCIMGACAVGRRKSHVIHASGTLGAFGFCFCFHVLANQGLRWVRTCVKHGFVNVWRHHLICLLFYLDLSWQGLLFCFACTVLNSHFNKLDCIFKPSHTCFCNPVIKMHCRVQTSLGAKGST